MYRPNLLPNTPDGPRALEETHHDPVPDQVPEAQKRGGADGETLDEDVRQVKVARLG